jgi:hypothetical protein
MAFLKWTLDFYPRVRKRALEDTLSKVYWYKRARQGGGGQ